MEIVLCHHRIIEWDLSSASIELSNGIGYLPPWGYRIEFVLDLHGVIELDLSSAFMELPNGT